MSIDVVIEFLNHNLISSRNRPLNATEIVTLKGIWRYRTYKQIALEAGYSPDYLTNVVAPELCKRLSQLVGQRVTKKTCRSLLEAYIATQATPTPAPSSLLDTVKARGASEKTPVTWPDQDSNAPRYPSGAVPIDSPYYIDRAPLEGLACEEIAKPGALVRIKAPQEMGKTSLLLRVLDKASSCGCHAVSLNLQQIDEELLNHLNRFLRWLCASVSRQLNLEPRLDDYWDEDIGAKLSCTLYFQNYLLANINNPLVLAIDEVNKLFAYPKVAKDVLPLFRSWYEEAKRLSNWQKLRLIIIHSTDIYVPLQLKQSPFNVGLPIQLGGFDLEQVELLAKCYGLDWTGEERIAQQLMKLVGGHPALIHITLYNLSRGEMTLESILEKSEAFDGIYSSHLQRHWACLEGQPELRSALTAVMEASEPISLEPTITYKLSSMGLIKQLGHQVIPGCELYRRFFIKRQL